MSRILEELGSLWRIVETLRGPDGCPWDKAQKLGDMGRYLLEEVGEVVDAIEDGAGRPTHQVREELGDVLMNVFLSAKICEDEGGFDLADVALGISEKLLRRHPHVFGDTRVEGVSDVLKNWNSIKAEEKASSGDRAATAPSILDRVPRSLPALERAGELSCVAAKVGFDWPEPRGAYDKVAEEVREVGEVLVSNAADREDRLEDELGDLLFAVANLCRKLGIRPESALRRTLRKFQARFRKIEERFGTLEGVSLEAMEAVWQEAKLPPGEGGPR
jgi:MazG family protein